MQVDIHINNLELKKKEFLALFNQHKKNEKILKILYYVFGSFTLILSVTLSFMTASLSFEDIDNTLNLFCFILSLIITVITSILNFLKIEDKISKHHATASSFYDLYLDIEKDLKSGKQDTKCIENEVFQRQKEILIHAPGLCFK